MRSSCRAIVRPARPARWVAAGGLGLALAAGPVACANDVVMPDLVTDTECGNDVLEPGEACDVKSPGCVDCEVAPGWSCPGNVCSVVCGDGVVGTGAGCESPHRDTDCDMSGYWAVRETDYLRDDVVGGLQASSTWYLYHLEQNGPTFDALEELDCGIHVTGSATVDLSAGSLRANMYANRMDAAGPHGARTGTSTAVAGGCAVSLERWYKIRGAVDSLLPGDFTASLPLTALPPLPSVSDPLTNTSFPAGATDPDGDGLAGMAFAITGFVSGTREAAQRDWKQYATTAGAPVPAAALTFVVPGQWDLQESVLGVTNCGGNCELVSKGAHVAQDAPPHITFSFIGKTFGGPRVSAVVTGVPRQSVDADLTTCANVRLALPHDPNPPPGVSSGGSL